MAIDYLKVLINFTETSNPETSCPYLAQPHIWVFVVGIAWKIGWNILESGKRFYHYASNKTHRKFDKISWNHVSNKTREFDMISWNRDSNKTHEFDMISWNHDSKKTVNLT